MTRWRSNRSKPGRGSVMGCRAEAFARSPFWPTPCLSRSVRPGSPARHFPAAPPRDASRALKPPRGRLSPAPLLDCGRIPRSRRSRSRVRGPSSRPEHDPPLAGGRARPRGSGGTSRVCSWPCGTSTPLATTRWPRAAPPAAAQPRPPPRIQAGLRFEKWDARSCGFRWQHSRGPALLRSSRCR